MAATAWLAVIIGAWIVYPWYRAEPPQGDADLAAFPKAYLLADGELTGWHTFAMEWKEHVGWLSPILATAVAYVVIRYRPQLAQQVELRRVLMIPFPLAFVTAAVSGALERSSTRRRRPLSAPSGSSHSSPSHYRIGCRPLPLVSTASRG